MLMGIKERAARLARDGLADDAGATALSSRS